MLSCYYLFGDRGVGKDADSAINWLMASAKNGDLIAQQNLAHCYETGTILKKDVNLAIFWYNESAKQGNVVALTKIQKLRGKNAK